MNLLIDTHVLLWWDGDDKKLGTAARDAIRNPTHQVFVSVASMWEIAIKRASGKLQMAASGSEIAAAYGFSPLMIRADHAEAAGALTWPHRDPFDRLIVTQARIDKLILVHADSIIRDYKNVAQLWAC